MSLLKLSENDEETAVISDLNIESLVDKLVLGTNMSTFEDISTFDEDYLNIHESQHGLELLIQTAFLHIKIPEKKRALTLLVVAEEEKLHNCRNMQSINPVILECFRAKAGSNEATKSFLESYNSPSVMDKLEYETN